MSGTVTFSDPQCFTDPRETMPLGNDLVQAVPSQVAIVYWNVLPSVPRDPTGQIHTEDMPPPLPMGNIPFESPSSGFESSSPSALHTRLHHEGPMYYQGVGSGCFGTTHQQPTLSPQITDPHSLVFDYTTTFTVPGTTVERPLATPTRSSPPTLDPSADAPVEYTEDVLQFLRMRGHQYECLWEDGSGRLCGYLGSLVGVKRHLRDSHRLERSTFCSVCEKSFYNPYSLRLHKNQHTGENPFKCKDCPMTFKSPNTRRSHQIRYHGYIPKQRRRKADRTERRMD